MENRNLFVGNLEAGITEEELYEQFSYFGQVRFIRYIKEKGIAFIRMSRAQDAYNARLGLNGVQLNSNRIRVLEARPKKQRKQSAQDTPSGTLDKKEEIR